MKQWEAFELQCTSYLSKAFGSCARFTHQGGADSTVPDILVETSAGRRFYMEAKHAPAQCGQFVLLPDPGKRQFLFSEKNVTRLTPTVRLIMDHMDRDFDAFREAGAAGKRLLLPQGQEVFSRWIMETYREKGVRFFITNDGCILPLEQVSDYFDISATYRIKRSGSGDVTGKWMGPVRGYLQSHFGPQLTGLFERDGKKLFVSSPQDLDRWRFYLEGYEYMLSRRGELYEVRRLSNTYNANVIFSIQLKRAQDPADLDRFRQELLH